MKARYWGMFIVYFFGAALCLNALIVPLVTADTVVHAAPQDRTFALVFVGWWILLCTVAAYLAAWWAADVFREMGRSDEKYG